MNKSDEVVAPLSATERTDLWKKIEGVKFAMLTTAEADGTMASRPLTTQQAEADGVLWFFISADGHLAKAIATNSRVGLTYADPGDSFYVSITGDAEVLRDTAKAKELWNPMAGAWFPQGPDDPSLALLRVDVDSGDTWEATSGKLVQFLSIAKAAITRHPPDDAGAHRTFVA